jgi:hypothetical protein
LPTGEEDRFVQESRNNPQTMQAVIPGLATGRPRKRPLSPLLMIFITALIRCGFTVDRSEIKVTPLVRQAAILDGETCGCSFRLLGLTGEGFDVLQTDLAESAVVGIAGRDVPLTAASAVDNEEPSESGQPRVRKFIAEDAMAVTLQTTIVEICAPAQEGCEIWGEQGTLVLSRGTTRAQYAIEGTCGC